MTLKAFFFVCKMRRRQVCVNEVFCDSVYRRGESERDREIEREEGGRG